MSTDLSLAWLGLLLLGALHGINPGMGWLFAVALGLQERRRRAVWRALLPLAAGHAAAIALAVVVAGLVGLIIPLEMLKWVVAAILLGFGIFRLFRSSHPRWGGMQVGMGDLAIWSFLMASAHGAGLMVVPLLLGMRGEGGGLALVHAADTAHAGHGAHLLAEPVAPAPGGEVLGGVAGDQLVGMLATLAHTAGYLLVTALVALIVYEKLGLRLLRSAWINLDLIWAGALILTAILTPLL